LRQFTVTTASPAFSRFDELLILIQSSFAYMRGAIDPPSSAERLNAQALAEKCRQETLIYIEAGGALVGCAFASPREGYLYLGKIAVSPDRQGHGLGRALLDAAIAEAKGRGLSELRLETRVELTANHRTFESWGFRRIGESAHPGFARPTSFTYALAI
jgi:ribosomal protein S18 acetylase RimI-like enzyme